MQLGCVVLGILLALALVSIVGGLVMVPFGGHILNSEKAGDEMGTNIVVGFVTIAVIVAIVAIISSKKKKEVGGGYSYTPPKAHGNDCECDGCGPKPYLHRNKRRGGYGRR